jgi:anti-sigma B factor antagonist
MQACKIITHEHGICIISLSGRLDMSKQKAVAEAIWQCESSYSSIILDFTDVQFISSSCLGTLVSQNKQLKAKKKQFILCGMSDPIMHIFEIMNLHRILDIRRDQAANIVEQLSNQ